MIDARPRSPSRVKSGLRLQIVMALAGMMLLAFVPLFFAVASLTRATVVDARGQAARSVGHAIAAHIADTLTLGGRDRLEHALQMQVGRGGVVAVCATAKAAGTMACAGSPLDVDTLRARARAGPEYDGATSIVRSEHGQALEVSSVAGDAMVVALINVDTGVDRGAALVRLVALYMIVFALALLVFAYFFLTRLIVRPIEHLVAAADRVASGARTLGGPTSGARELVELSASVQAMATKLIAEEATLLLKVEELTDTTKRLTDTQAQLVRSERMASVGRLAAGLAHEIGNPIAALIGMEDLLLDGGLEPDDQKDFLKRMRRETERIHLIVRDLLDFARPEGRDGTESSEPVPAIVGAVVDDVVALVKPQKPFRDIRIDTDVSPSLRVALPASKLTQVLLNITLNAGAAIASHRDAGHVAIRAAAVDSNRVRIEVEDDGPGISEAVRDRLFEPFVTTKEVGAGTGLGLAVCRGLVESAGGEIGIDPAFQRGARFYIVLPSVKG